MTLVASVGIAQFNADNEIIEVYYLQPVVLKVEEQVPDGIIAQDAKFNDERLQKQLQKVETNSKAVFCRQKLADPPQNVLQSFLKLHCLSHRLTKPNTINLDGIFGKLHNLAWTSQGAITIAELPDRILQSRLNGTVLSVYSVDKFPVMTNYVVPTGVRIANTARVRLGAYIGEGTTIMHEGFVNFNAGTCGPNMVEGRISAGVWVDANSDLGGGCSTMGTLSGGGNQVIAIGKNCLIGANAGTGISLGDKCTIEAGLYITAGTKVNLITNDTKSTCKALHLSGQSGLLFRRNSVNGQVECITNNKTVVELNKQLHEN